MNSTVEDPEKLEVFESRIARGEKIEPSDWMPAEYRKQLKAFAERKYKQLLDKLAFAKKAQRMADAKAAGLKAASQGDNIFSLDAARAQRSANAQAMQVRQLQQELSAA